MANAIAWAEGAQIGKEAAQHSRDRKEVLSNEDRQIKAQDLIDTRHNTLANLPSIKGLYGEDSPQYKNAINTITQSQYDLSQLYDPIKAPNALQSDWHFLLNKIHGIKLPNGMKKPSSSSKKSTGSQDSPAAPNTSQAAQAGAPASSQAAAPSPAANTPVVPPAGAQVPTAAAPLTWKTRGQYQSPKEIKQKLEAMQQAQKQAALEASSIGLTPQEQAMAKFQSDEAISQAKMDATLATAKKLGLSDTEISELKQQLVGLKNINPKPLPGAAGQPVEFPPGSGLYARGVVNPDGSTEMLPMPKGWKPQVVGTKGTLIHSKQHGWIELFYDKHNPSKIIGWLPTTPSRYYQGTMTSGKTTDAFGVTTSSSHLTKPTDTAPIDVDLSGAQELPSDFNGTDNSANPVPEGQTSTSAGPTPSGTVPASVSKPEVTPASLNRPKRSATPSELKSQIPAPPSTSATPQFQVDAAGHIPDVDTSRYRLNPNLVQIANNIIDGQDISKIGLKDRGAAEQLAMKYGWKGQGLFTPRESLQIKEGASFLNKMANSPALKVLDNGFFSNLPMVGASPDPAKEGFFGRITTNLSSRNQSPEQQEFMDLYRQLDAMAIGLRALVQAGRGTQKQADLLISELPNPYNTPSSKDAKRRLQLVRDELDIAAKTGKLPDIEQMQDDFNSSTPSPSGKVPTGGALDQYMKSKGLPPINH